MQVNSYTDPELGVLRSEHGPGWTSRVVVFVVVGLVMLIFVAAGISEGDWIPSLVAVAIGLALIGALQFFVSGLRLRVFEHGIERRSRFGTKRLAWPNLDTYQLQIVDTAMAAGAGAGGLLGALLARLIIKAVRKNNELVPNAVILRGKDGAKVVLSANVKGYRELLTTLLPYLVERLLPNARQAYEAGGEISFGKKLSLQRGVGITFTGLFGKKQVLPLEQTAAASLDGPALAIRRSDTNAVWQSVPAATVLNPGVLQKLVELTGKPYDERIPMAWTS